MLLRSNFPSSPQHVQYISNFKSPITYLLNVINRIICFLNSANLICRGTDISKYFRESLGIRDNESRCICNRKLHRSDFGVFTRVGWFTPPPQPIHRVVFLLEVLQLQFLFCLCVGGSVFRVCLFSHCYPSSLLLLVSREGSSSVTLGNPLCYTSFITRGQLAYVSSSS